MKHAFLVAPLLCSFAQEDVNRLEHAFDLQASEEAHQIVLRAR